MAELYTVYLDSTVGGIVEHRTELGVDGVAGGKCLVELHLTDDTRGSLSQLLYRIRQIADFINTLERIYNI